MSSHLFSAFGLIDFWVFYIISEANASIREWWPDHHMFPPAVYNPQMSRSLNGPFVGREQLGKNHLDSGTSPSFYSHVWFWQS